jgi:tRNA (mo5U34)-methyltransferase
MKAGDRRITEQTRRQIEQLQALGWYHSIELPNGEIIRGLQTPEQLHRRVRQFPIPGDLTGKRVLDIGAWDGWFSFEMEKRGASVVAVDAVPKENFLAARELLGSKVEFLVRDVYDLRPEELGHFDIVLFLGVLYHLKHPMLALERVSALAADLVCVESFVTDDGSDPALKPAMEFYETTELCGQFDNWVGPNTACLTAMCRAAGFVRVKLESVLDNRAHVTCYRKWGRGAGSGPAPYIVCVENSVSRDHDFSARRDDYLSVWFKTAESALTEDDVFVEVADYAARPVTAHATGGDGWLVIVKLPAGLTPGWREVRLRVRESAWSNTVRIGMDVTGEDRRRRTAAARGGPDFRIEIVADGKTWERNQVRRRADACISLWVRGLAPELGAADVTVRLGGGAELPAVFVSEPDQAGLRQVNALLPSGIPTGPTEVNVAAGEAVTPPAAVEVLPA